MKILLALNSFKGSYSSLDANLALKSGMQELHKIKEIKVFPLCDGGDGSISALHYHLAIPQIKVRTYDALGNPLNASYLLDKSTSTAYIELANASGIARLRSKPDILQANTEGTGILTLHAIRRGATRIILMVGGSATNDAGIGFLHQLGVRFMDKENNELKPIPANLIHIHHIQDINANQRKNLKFEVWTDVTNPFDGKEGAVAVYSKQKGATITEQTKLEKGMIHFRKIISKKYAIHLNEIRGTGAAGGIGGGMIPILNAKLKHGTTEIFRLIGFRHTLKHYDIAITGEGRLDIQSGYGKLVQGVIQETKKAKIPVIGVCGSTNLNPQQLKKMGFDAVFSIVPGPVSLEDSILNTGVFLKNLGTNLAGMIHALINRK